MRFSRKILYHWGGFINQMLRLYTYIKRNVYYAVFRGFKATTWYLFLKGTNLLKYIKVTYSQMFNRVQVWNRRFLPLGICFIIFRFIVATQVCYCMLLHATACYCYLPFMMQLLVHVKLWRLPNRKYTWQRQLWFYSSELLRWRVPRPLLKPERLKFWYPSYALAAWKQFPSHFLPKWPSAWAPSFVLQGWQNM